MMVYHKHSVLLMPNSLAAKTYAEQIKANVEKCTVTELTIGISVEWYDTTVVTDSEEGGGSC